ASRSASPSRSKRMLSRMGSVLLVGTAPPTVVSALSRPALETVNFMGEGDRKSTRLNSSHVKISYAVCGVNTKAGMQTRGTPSVGFHGLVRTCVLSLTLPRPARSTLFPYTTLFRSRQPQRVAVALEEDAFQDGQRALGRHGPADGGERLEQVGAGDGELHGGRRSEEHTSELQSREDLVCRLRREHKSRDADPGHAVRRVPRPGADVRSLFDAAAPSALYTLSLHDALPISPAAARRRRARRGCFPGWAACSWSARPRRRW